MNKQWRHARLHFALQRYRARHICCKNNSKISCSRSGHSNASWFRKAKQTVTGSNTSLFRSICLEYVLTRANYHFIAIKISWLSQRHANSPHHTYKAPRTNKNYGQSLGNIVPRANHHSISIKIRCLSQTHAKSPHDTYKTHGTKKN